MSTNRATSRDICVQAARSDSFGRGVDEGTEMKEIEVHDLESILVTGARLIDVREPDEYAAGHVPGAVSIPLGQIPDRIDECGPLGETLYMICRSGARSANACSYLEDRGRSAVNVVGGTMAWMASGRSVIEGDSAQ